MGYGKEKKNIKDTNTEWVSKLASVHLYRKKDEQTSSVN